MLRARRRAVPPARATPSATLAACWFPRLAVVRNPLTVSRFRLAMALVVAWALPPAAAIQTRPDRGDEEYRELATRYAAAVPLPTGGAAVLVAPRWLLTTAHRAEPLTASRSAILITGRPHAIQRVWLHPEASNGAGADIALLLLAEPVAGIEPAPIHREPNESGQALRFVGFGPTGPMGKPPAASDGKARAAINTVDRVLPRELGMRIKGPDDASDLQGLETLADSGGPGIIEVARRPFVAGLLLKPEGTGAIGHWTRLVRVSAFAEWIDDVMGRAALEEAVKPASSSSSTKR